MHELQIELHDVGLEPKDVPEAREPRADVVDRELCPACAQRRKRLGQLVVILDLRVLRDLDDQPVGDAQHELEEPRIQRRCR